jgi:hypothetical protein
LWLIVTATTDRCTQGVRMVGHLCFGKGYGLRTAFFAQSA